MVAGFEPPTVGLWAQHFDDSDRSPSGLERRTLILVTWTVGIQGIMEKQYELHSPTRRPAGRCDQTSRSLPADFQARHSHIPWPQIVAFRNILVHAYFGIDWDVVWRAAENPCPVLPEQVTEILVSGIQRERRVRQVSRVLLE